MPELGEIIAPPSLEAELKEHCPFKQAAASGDPKKPENPEDDDTDEVEGLQENDGGVLGQNLSGKKAGDGTSGPFPPTDFLHEDKPNDSKRGKQSVIHLREYKDAEAADFPFTVAAHHLIPGNASLYDEENVGLINYMEDGKTVKTAAKNTYTIQGHIGYDVNGSHNGVWLPGNYAIKRARPERKRKDGTVVPAQEGTTPVEDLSWSKLGNDYEPWQYMYVAGACKAGKGQFHDSHEQPYSATVRKNLLAIVTALNSHLDSPCPDCKNAEKKIPPPHRMKMRFYALSATLRGFVTGVPQAWKAPWFTSERWSKKYFNNGDVTKEFLDAYDEAKVVDK